MPRIEIPKKGTSVEASSAVSLLNNLLRSGIKINHVCGGKALCGTCRVTILSGMENLSPVLSSERKRLQAVKARENQRLACQTYVKGDISIEIPGT